jgi:hypothetical protein
LEVGTDADDPVLVSDVDRRPLVDRLRNRMRGQD